MQLQQLGIVADLGANWLLPKMAGRGRALATRQMVDDASRESFPALLEREWMAQRELCGLPVFTDSVASFLSK